MYLNTSGIRFLLNRYPGQFLNGISCQTILPMLHFGHLAKWNTALCNIDVISENIGI
jgi:hypothetical protein